MKRFIQLYKEGRKITNEKQTVTGSADNKKKKPRKKKSLANEKRFEELTNCLTEELFEIAIGQGMDDNGGKSGSASLSERLKAAELLARYRKNSSETESEVAPAIIIDDIS